jgi:hypothetical protein
LVDQLRASVIGTPVRAALTRARALAEWRQDPPGAVAAVTEVRRQHRALAKLQPGLLTAIEEAIDLPGKIARAKRRPARPLERAQQLTKGKSGFTWAAVLVVGTVLGLIRLSAPEKARQDRYEPSGLDLARSALKLPTVTWPEGSAYERYSRPLPLATFLEGRITVSELLRHEAREIDQALDEECHHVGAAIRDRTLSEGETARHEEQWHRVRLLANPPRLILEELRKRSSAQDFSTRPNGSARVP